MATARRRIAGAVVVAVCGLVVTAVVLALLSRPDLNRAQDRVDAAWAELHPHLVLRYDTLADASTVARERLGRASGLTTALDAAVDNWRNAGTAAAQLTAANRLEGLAVRLSVTAGATPRLASSPTMQDRLAAVRESAPDDARRAYNRRVAEYEDERRGWLRELLAGALGFDASRSLESPAL